MKLNRTLALAILPAIISGCNYISTVQQVPGASSGQSTPVSPSGNNSPPPVTAISNVMTLSVNGSLCSANSYPNKPCVNVTICTPGTNTCQTINDIILDTGSIGLRVFKSVLSIGLTPETSAGSTIAQCVTFGDGSSMWGPVETANLILANEPAVSVPIQVVDSTFSNSKTYCNGADASPAAAGLNGILGVGSGVQDCGADCVTAANNGLYFACMGNTCNGTTVSLANQLENPIAALPKDNNGLIVELPSVPLGGLPMLAGQVILGIGTEANNMPSGGQTYGAGDTASGIQYTFLTSFSGQADNGFLDTGSNTYAFTPPSATQLPDCKAVNANFAGFFCPAAPVSLSATNTGSAGSPTGAVAFQIGHAVNLFNSGNSVFAETGTSFGIPNLFDFGLPFFYGRNVYVGISGTKSSLGTGPYWAY